jgi:orotate phosphoribosyltransferase
VYYEKQTLIKCFEERAIRFGDFTLASGRKSTYYIDKMHVTLDSRGLYQISTGIWELLFGVQYNAVGGMVIGADPIVGAVLMKARSCFRDMTGFLVRKEPKDHGTQSCIEGPLQPGDRAVIIEDVVTTGGSALAAVDRVEAFGAKVVMVVGVVDRLEGGAEAFAARGIKYASLLTLDDFPSLQRHRQQV